MQNFGDHLMLMFYRISIKSYGWAIALAALWNEKAQLWIRGRKTIWQQLAQHRALAQPKFRIWIHVSSLGEFEQGRTLIETLKKQYPDCFIYLTFFSPSGYEIRKNYPLVDAITYLPIDNDQNAKRFLELVNPQLILWVKYDFWYYFLTNIKKKAIPCILVAATFRKEQLFFKKYYGNFYKHILTCFSQIFVQNETDRKLLQNIDIQNVIVAGDTRIDRVVETSLQTKYFPLITNFINNRKVFVAGSTWQPDEEIIITFIKNNSNLNYCYIIAPHDIGEKHMNVLTQKLQETKLNYSKYSTLTNDIDTTIKILIIDNIGMLSSLYRYGTLAYIGGGFGKGIHNTLEPAAFGLPIIFGPNYQKFEEAKQFIAINGAFVIHNSNDFNDVISLLNNNSNYQIASNALLNYLNNNKGATLKIMHWIKTIKFPAI